jgi:hypothetical protein
MKHMGEHLMDCLTLVLRFQTWKQTSLHIEIENQGHGVLSHIVRKWFRKPPSRFLEAAPSCWHVHSNCRAQFHLDPVAELEASLSSAGFSGSPLWPFALF